MGRHSPGPPHWAAPLDRLAPLTRGNPPAVLLIDDDLSTRELVQLALRPLGFRVETASSAVDGMAIARLGLFDVLLVDLRLPDMSGTELVRALRDDIADLRFVLFSGFLTTADTVEAMRLGAIDVIEKPVAIDELLALVRSIVGQARPAAGRDAPRSPDDITPPAWRGPRTIIPGCAAERWAMHVLKGCGSSSDIKTLKQWAVSAGVSYTSLRENCRLVGIRPHDARDFMRVLRAVIRSHAQCCDPAVLLDVSDSRTLAILCERAGLDARARSGAISIEQFLSAQRFVTEQNAALGFLKHRLATGQTR
jgi:ActR/RegA family two-component response regulator